MERWHGKIAIVTGASSGIGSHITHKLIKNGLNVIGLSRNIIRLENLKKEIQSLKDNNNSSSSSTSLNFGEFYYHQCDITNLESIKQTFKWIQNEFRNNNLCILINNAGIYKYTSILLNDNNENDLQSIINTNFMGTIYCTKYAYEIMIKQQHQQQQQIDNENTIENVINNNNNNEYHIINMNSILGHKIPFGKFSKNYNIYPSSKYAIRAASEILRQELIDNENFRVTNISPGLVKTDITHTAGHPSADHIINNKSILMPDDIANAIIYVLSVPKHVQITELTIIPVGQKF